MSILLFSDIHASRKSADELYRLAPLFDHLVCAGDVCGYNTSFAYMLDMFKELGVHSVLGNHDVMVLNNHLDISACPDRVKNPIYHTRENITDSQRKYLLSFPESLEIENLFVIHTWDFDQYLHNTADCFPLFSLTDRPFIGIGHTHQQAIHSYGERRVINPGSFTFGRKGKPRGYAVIEGDSITLETLE